MTFNIFNQWFGILYRTALSIIPPSPPQSYPMTITCYYEGGSVELTPIRIPLRMHRRPSTPTPTFRPPISSPTSPLVCPPGVPRVYIQKFKAGTCPYPPLRLPSWEVTRRPPLPLEDRSVVFLEDFGVVKLDEADTTNQWVVYRCVNQRLGLAEIVIFVPRCWVIRTHWDRVKVRFDSFWLALKASLRCS